MTRLYPEMEKGALSERGVMFGREQNGQPGEAHYWEEMRHARGATQQRAHFDPNYDPSRVEGLGDLGRHRRGGGRRHGGWHGGGPVIIEEREVWAESPCPEGQRLYRDPGSGRRYCGPAERAAPALLGLGGVLSDHWRSLVELAGLGESFQVSTIQKTQMQRRDFAPDTRSDLPSVMQHFEQGLVRPEGKAEGLRVLAENGATARTTRAQHGRLRAELRASTRIPVEVNALGELEPRMGVWGHEQSDRQSPWVSPPGPRRLPGGGVVVPTQEARLVQRGLSGLGDLAGKRSQRLMQFATMQNQAIQAAVAKGDVQAAITAAAVTPWQHSGTGVTQQQVDAKLATPLGYQDISAKIARAMGDTSVKLPTTVPVMLPSGQQAAQLAPTSPTTPIRTATAAPQPLQNVVAPGMPTQPTQPAGPIPLPGAPPPPMAGGGYGSGGGGGGGMSLDAPQDTTAAPAPSGPLGFLQKPITLPLLGSVPTWGVLAAAGAVALYLRKRKKASAAGTKANPKRKGKKK